MTISINGTSGIVNDATDLSYTGTLTGGTGVVNLGSGQVYKDASGNVGIGTSSPTARLTIASGTNEGAVRVGDNATYYGALARVQATDEVRLGAYGPSQNLTFYTNASERARITSGGYFKASASGGYNSDTGPYHELRGAGANSYELILANTNASPASQYIQDIRFTAATPNNTNARFLACTDTTNEKAAILSTGGFLSRNNSYGTYSDIKLKENIVEATPKLDDVLQLRVCNFNFKLDATSKQIGFIAQEFEQVFPALVDESEDRGADGTFTGEVTKSIKTSVLVPILVKAIQEQQTLITQQAAALTALTARITALEAAA